MGGEGVWHLSAECLGEQAGAKAPEVLVLHSVRGQVSGGAWMLGEKQKTYFITVSDVNG
jgi:hypothetical protein